jgi:hypothetical protein
MKDWGKTRAEADIAQFKNAVEDATIEEVNEPAGKKDVEIGYNKEQTYVIEKGKAVGVYYEYSDDVGLDDEHEPAIEVVHIDWTDERNRTSVKFEDINVLEEGEYYTES